MPWHASRQTPRLLPSPCTAVRQWRSRPLVTHGPTVQPPFLCAPLYPPQASAEVFNYFLGGNKDEKTIEMGAPLAHNFTMRGRKGVAWRAEPWAQAGWTTVDRVGGWGAEC